MNLKQAKELVRGRLSDKRYEHTINVKKMAVKLAKHYGADEEQAALAALLGAEEAALLASPNNTLAVEYLRAVRRLGSPLTARTVRRTGAQHGEDASGVFASASYLRQLLAAEADRAAERGKRLANLLEKALTTENNLLKW